MGYADGMATPRRSGGNDSFGKRPASGTGIVKKGGKQPPTAPKPPTGHAQTPPKPPSSGR
jgi:hypothetical protein